MGLTAFLLHCLISRLCEQVQATSKKLYTSLNREMDWQVAEEKVAHKTGQDVGSCALLVFPCSVL